MIPNWLQSLLSEADLSEIEEQVRRQESKTSGEIVTVIVQRSTPLGFLGWWIGLSFILIYFVLELQLSADWWIRPWQHYLILVGFIGLGHLLARFSRFQRAFLPLKDQTLSVERRAELELYHSKVTKTKYRTAILVFISVMERRAVILGDVGIAQKIPPETWDKIVKSLVEHKKQGNLKGGLLAAIEQSGALLSQHFPIEAGDENELKDAVIIKA